MNRLLTNFCLLLAPGLGMLVQGCITIPFNSDRPTTYFEVAGSGTPMVYMLRVDGVITSESTMAGIIRGEPVPGTVEQVRYQLDRIERDRLNPAAILLRINSPGGTVTASDIIYHEVSAFKKRHGIPVVVLMMDIATSGGYYVAMAGDFIVAHPTTTTGSLGVIMPSFNLAKLMEKYGVEDSSIASGPFKDLGSMTRPPRREHTKVLQSVVDGLYQRFLTVVREGRGDRLTKPLEKLADGRIYTAHQAKKAGLVDRVGYFEGAMSELRRLTGLSEFRVVTLDQRSDRDDANIYMERPRGGPRPLSAASALLGFSPARAPFYYLWLPQ